MQLSPLAEGIKTRESSRIMGCAANKMDAALRRGFIRSTESFVGNVAETEITVDAILHYFHWVEPTYVAK